MSLYTLTVDLLAKTGSFASDMGRAARIADKETKKIRQSFIDAGKVMGTAIAVGATTAAVALTALTKSAINNADSIRDMSIRLGTSTELLSAYGYAATQTGTNLDTLAKGMKLLAKNAADAINPTSEQAKIFDALGVKVTDATGKLRGLDALIPDVANKFKSLEDGTTKAALAQALFGKSGLDLTEFLNQGSRGLDEFAAKAERLGIIIDSETAAAADNFNDSLGDLRVMMQGFGLSVAKELLPALNEATKSFGDIVEQGDAAREVADTIAAGFKIVTGAAIVVSSTVRGVTADLIALWHAAEAGRKLTILGGFDFDGAKKEFELARIAREMAAEESADIGRVFNGEPPESPSVPTPVFAGDAPMPDSMFKFSEREVAARKKSDDLERRLAEALSNPTLSTTSDSAKRKAERDAQRQLDSLMQFEQQAKMAAAAMSGPLDEAMAQHLQNMAEYITAVEQGNAKQGDANVLMAQSAIEYAKAAQAIEDAQRAPEALLDTMSGELQLLGMIGPARELYRRQLQNEADMRRAINEANDAGAGINDEVSASLMQQARAYAAVSMEAEEAAAAAEEWAHTIMGSVEGVADVFADLFSGQIKNAKDFFSELKDVFKRGWWDIVRTSLQQEFVNPFQKALMGMMSGQGNAAAGQSMNSLVGAATQMFGGRGMQAASLGGFGLSTGAGIGTGVGGLGNTLTGAMVDGQFVPIAQAGSGGGFGMGNASLLGPNALPYLGGIAGAYYGLKNGGSGGVSTLAAGASYGALGMVGGSLALGALGGAGAAMGATAGAGLYAGASAAAGGAAAGAGTAAMAIPVVGWVLAAMAVIDMISGGKLFGTKYKAQEVTQTIGVGADGGTASVELYETRQKALFGGIKRRTREVDPSEEMLQSAADVFESMEAVAQAASDQLGLTTVDIIAGSFKQVYDKKGKLKSEASDVLGKIYNETFEDFQKRLGSEQIIAAVAQVDAAASAIADDWRDSITELEAGAQFFLFAAADMKNGMDLWSGIGLEPLTEFVDQMQKGGESLLEAYQRLAGSAKSYGDLIAGVQTDLMTGGLTAAQQQALAIERGYRQQIKAANDYAKALGLTGARSEDLAKIEELRAVNMGKLQAQMEIEKAASLNNLALSDLSPLRDAEKLDLALKQLEAAVNGGDIGAANSASQAALGFGRNLFASGRDYNAIYEQVTGMLGGMQPGTLDMEDGTTMGELAETLDALPEKYGKAIFELAASMQADTTSAVQEVGASVDDTNAILRDLLDETRRQRTDRLRDSVNAR